VLTPLALQSLFWCSPIVYPVDVLPAFLQPWVALNPVYAPLSTAQALLLGTALREIGRKHDLTKADIDAIEGVRDSRPAEPMTFE
jgi:ABC-type polysaccharide/polyol phosphate export permease